MGWIDNNVLNFRNSPAQGSGLLSEIPVTGPLGMLYISTDTQALYRYDGSGWVLIGGPGTGTLTGSGTVGKLAKFTGATVLGDSIVSEAGTVLTVAGSLMNNGTVTINSGASISLLTSGNINISSLGDAYLYLNNTTPITGKNWQVGSIANGDFSINNFTSGNVALTITPALAISTASNLLVNGTITANQHIVPSGTSAQFLKADGTLDSTSYIPTAAIGVTVQPYNANTTILGNTTTGTGSIVLNNQPALILPSFTAIQVTGGIASLPTGSGTLLYASTLTGYVPYTGATANVDLGLFNLAANRGNFGGAIDNVSYALNVAGNSIIEFARGSGGPMLYLSNTATASNNSINQILFKQKNVVGGLEDIAAITAINTNGLNNNGGDLYFSVSQNGSSTTPFQIMRLYGAGYVYTNSRLNVSQPIDDPLLSLNVLGDAFISNSIKTRLYKTLTGFVPTSATAVLINTNYSGPGYNNASLTTGNEVTGIGMGGDIGSYSYAWIQAFQTDNTGNIKNLLLQPLGGSVTIGNTVGTGTGLLYAGNGRFSGSIAANANISINSDNDANLYITNTTATTGRNWLLTSAPSGAITLGTFTSGTILTIIESGPASLTSRLNINGIADNASYSLNMSGGINNTTGNNYFNSTSGNTSIGTATNTYKLNVAGGIYDSDSQATLNQSKFGVFGGMTFTATGTETAQYINAGIAGGYVMAAAGSFTPLAKAKQGAIVGSYYMTAASTVTGMQNCIYANCELASSGTITTLATIRAGQPDQFSGGSAFTGTITNMVGIYIDDISGSSLASKFTNKYGIYQVGTSDKNFFGGEIILGSGQVVSASVLNTVTNKIKLIANGTTYYLLASTSAT